MKESKVKVNEIYSSNHSGDFIVLKPMGTMNKNMTYLVRFLKTGYETITRYDSILNGTVKDPYFPRIYGVGYFGEPSEQNKAMYYRWRCMLSRCYNPNNKRYKQYGGIGVRVCDRWLCYATYLNDIKTLPGYDDMIRNPQIQYCLDKDMLQKAGMQVVGTSPEGGLPEIVERTDHPWFIGVQFHPELKSRPFAPHPLFVSFVTAAIDNSRLV